MDDLKKIAGSYHWEKWLARPWFGALVLSIFADGFSRRAFEKIGISGVEMEAWFFQDGHWYADKRVFDDLAAQFRGYLKDHDVFDVTRSLDAFYAEKKKRMLELNKAAGEGVIPAFAEVCDILSSLVAYIWVAHGLEAFYTEKLKTEVPKYVTRDVDEFVASASFPVKKNAYVLFEEEILSGVDPEKIVEKYGWIRARDAYSEAFTVAEILALKKDLKPNQVHARVEIPAPLRGLFAQVQELVYFRTARTDVLYEFLFLARPLFRKVAEKYGIAYEQLRFYESHSLIEGKPVKYSLNFSAFGCKGRKLYSNEPLLVFAAEEKKDFVKGQVAQKGVVTGVVKIIQSVSELGKVKPGDVLVTPMTFPSYISAMAIACAFVTDEGGITCHAAIVAREMRKPCVIGTKQATRTFKDGDLVEVDADKGIVKLVKRA